MYENEVYEFTEEDYWLQELWLEQLQEDEERLRQETYSTVLYSECVGGDERYD